VPIEARPAIPSAEERHAERAAERAAKDQRRVLKKHAEKVESAMGVAERILKRAGKEVAMRKRLIDERVAAAAEGGQ
jgi:small subunit ribosomal protein S17